jgi:hypothetical protein
LKENHSIITKQNIYIYYFFLLLYKKMLYCSKKHNIFFFLLFFKKCLFVERKSFHYNKQNIHIYYFFLLFFKKMLYCSKKHHYIPEGTGVFTRGHRCILSTLLYTSLHIHSIYLLTIFIYFNTYHSGCSRAPGGQAPLNQQIYAIHVYH